MDGEINKVAPPVKRPETTDSGALGEDKSLERRVFPRLTAMYPWRIPEGGRPGAPDFGPWANHA